MTSAAACGDWHQQSNYGDRWSTASMWWEYSCSEIVSQELNNPCAGGGGACNAECQYCQWETQSRIDYFHWDGTNAVFTGQSYTDSNLGAGDANADEVWGGSDWWDAATAQWYDLSPTITSLTPASGPVGTVVDIQGWNFNGATSVTFDGGYGWFGFAPGSPVSYTIDSNTEIHITVPDWAASGLISVTTPDGTAVSASAFTLTAP